MAGEDNNTILKFTGNTDDFLAKLKDARKEVDGFAKVLGDLNKAMNGLGSGTAVKDFANILKGVGGGALWELRAGDQKRLEIGITNAVTRGIQSAFSSLDANIFSKVTKGFEQSVKAAMQQASLQATAATPQVSKYLTDGSLGGLNAGVVRSTKDLEKLQAMLVATQVAFRKATEDSDMSQLKRTTALGASIQTRIDELRKLAADNKALIAAQGGALISQNKDEIANAKMALVERAALAAEAAAKNRDEVSTARMVIAERQRQAALIAAINKDEIANAKMQLAYKRQMEKEAAASPEGKAARLDETMANRMAALSHNGGSDIFLIQARLMANYAIMNNILSGFQNSIKFVKDFEVELLNLQAISQATTVETEKLSNTFLKATEYTKFTGVEVAGAGTTLAQAGFSTSQIQESIQGVVQLSVATGTTLKNGVDIATSTIGAFNLQAGQMGEVANLVSAALNVSKLDSEKFALGLQYAGNTAAELGVTLGDTTTALALMSNTGIKSGSTLGTGLRQVLEALTVPTDTFKQVLNRLNISLEDVDVKSQGLLGALKNLRASGFTTADAIQAFGVRSAAAMAALFSSVDKMDSVKESIINGGDAAKAAAIQMDSLEGAQKKLTNALDALAYKTSGPVVDALKAVYNGTAALFRLLGENETLLSVTLVTGFSLASAAVLTFTASLSAGLVTRFTAAISETVAMMRVATTATQALSIATAAVNPVFLVLTVAVAAATAGWGYYAEKQREAKKAAEENDTKINETKGRLDSLTSTASTLQTELDRLAAQYGKLARGGEGLSAAISEINKNLQSMGFYTDANSTSIDGLIGKLRDLQKEVNRQSAEQALIQSQQLEARRRVELEAATRPGAEQNKALIRSSPELYAAIRFSMRSSESEMAALPQPDREAYAQITNAMETLKSVNTTDLNSARAVYAQVTRDLTTTLNMQGLTDDLRKALQDIRADVQTRLTAASRPSGTEAAILTQRQVEAESRFKTGALGESLQHFGAETKAAGSEIQARFTTEALKARGENDTTEAIKAQADLIASYVEARKEALKLLINDAKQQGVGAEGRSLISDASSSIKQLEGVEKKLRQDYASAVTDKLRGDIALLELKLRGAKDQGNAALEQTLVGQIKSAKKRLNEVVAGASTKRGDVTSVEKSGADLQAEETAKNYLVELDQRIAKMTVERLNVKKDTLARQMSAAKSTATSKTSSLDEAKAAAQQYASLIPQMLSVENKIARREVEAFKYSSGADKDAALKERIQENLADSAKFRNEFDNMNAGLSDVIRQWSDSYKKINEGIKQAKASLKAADVSAEMPISESNKAIASARGQYRSSFLASSQVWEQQKLQQDVLLPAQAEQQIKNQVDYQQKLADLSEQITRTTKELVVERDKLDEGSATRVDIQAKITELSAKEADISAATSESKAKQLALEEKLANLKAAKSPQDYGEATGVGIKKWLASSGALKDQYTVFAEDLPQAFNATSSAFGTAMTSIVTRTKTVGDAFKDMAKSILEAMLKIAQNQLAASLMKGLVSVVGGMFGSSTPASGANTNGFNSSTPNYGYVPTTMTSWNGGLVARRAAAGYGPIPTRDSQLIYAAPGEFIMRQSAVDLIGADTLSSLNAMGNRRTSQASSNILKQDQKKEPVVTNVYVVNKDQAPPAMTANDVMVAWSQDVLTGGQSKKLIKAVVSGAV